LWLFEWLVSCDSQCHRVHGVVQCVLGYGKHLALGLNGRAWAMTELRRGFHSHDDVFQVQCCPEEVQDDVSLSI
ncbi:hypothetical protein M513_13814, partial [Trichuris suis]